VASHAGRPLLAMNSNIAERLISVEVCDDPIDIELMTVAVGCERRGSDEKIVAMIRFTDFPDCNFLAVCGECYRALIRHAVGRVV
jgi:hypothetical protein